MSKSRSKHPKKAPLQNLEPEDAGSIKAGFGLSPSQAAQAAARQRDQGSSSGGQNDPAQMFQQILQQMTQQG